MIITNCPYRVSFFGGGTDFKNWYSTKGANIISCSINSFCYITIRKLLPFYGNKYRISWSNIEEVNNINLIKHPAIKGALKYMDIKNGLEIHTDGDMPARSGLGSSSAFSAALLLALSEYKGKKLSISELTKETIFFEQSVLKENVGIQDQIQTCNGGFNLLSINQEGDYRLLRLDLSSPLVKSISKNMYLLFTGHTRKSTNIQKENQNISSEIRYKSLDSIAKIAENVTNKIIKKEINFEQFASYIEESWDHKTHLLSESEKKDQILDIYKKAMRAGAASGKLLGAGGGGFFLFLVEDKHKKDFLEKMSQYTIVKQNITNNPCQLIFRKS